MELVASQKTKAVAHVQDMTELVQGHDEMIQTKISRLELMCRKSQILADELEQQNKTLHQLSDTIQTVKEIRL